jgi:O-antigen ligase
MNVWRRGALASGTVRRLDLVVVVAGLGACVVGGLAAAERGSIALLLLVGMCGLALVTVFQEIGFGVLLVWIVLSGPLYPLLSTAATDTPIGFDRVIIVGMASWLVLRRDGLPWSTPSRRLAGALLWLLIAFGIRAALTSQAGLIPATEGDARLTALNAWLDAIVLPVLLYLTVARFADTTAKRLQVAGGMAVAGALLGTIGVAEKLLGFELASYSGGEARFDPTVGVVRVAGPYSVPEVYAVVLLVCLGATLWWMLVRGRNLYPVGMLAIALELCGLGVTLFRAALIGAILIIVAALGLRPGRILRVSIVTALTGLILFLTYVQLQDNKVFEGRLQNTENIKGRLATYAQGGELFRRHPLVGVGIGQFANAQEAVNVTVFGGVEAVSSPHSTFVGVIAEQGIVGFVALLACLWAIWWLLRALRRHAREHADILLWACLVGVCVAYLVMSLTLSMLPYGPSNAFFAIALGLAAARVNQLVALERSQAR